MNIKFKLTGVRPLIMHNGRLADPLDAHAKEMKKLSAQRNKTDEVHAAMADMEWRGSLYWSDALGLYVPADNLQAMIEAAAAKLKLRQIVKSAVFVDLEIGAKIQLPEVVAKLKTVDALMGSPLCRLRVGVVVQRARVMRTRPMVPSGWTAEVPIDFDETLLNLEQVTEVMHHSQNVGLGDWRPRFGRFTVEEV